MNGERFYLLQDESALRQHDETHLFRVGIDGDKLAGGLDEALELLSKESTKVDVYADTYSPNRSERDFDRLGEDPFMKWVGIGFCVMMICLGISMLVRIIIIVSRFMWADIKTLPACNTFCPGLPLHNLPVLQYLP